MTTYTFNEFQEFEVGIDVSLDDIAERLDTDDLAYLLEQFDASEISSTINQLDEGTLGAATDAISERLDEDLSRTLDERLTRIIESPRFGASTLIPIPITSRDKLFRTVHNLALGTGFYENLPANERQHLAARLGNPPVDTETETQPPPSTNEALQFTHFINSRSIAELANLITDDQAVWVLAAIARNRSLSVLQDVFRRLHSVYHDSYTSAIAGLHTPESENASEPDDLDDSEDDDLERTLEHLVTAPSDRLAGLPDVHWHTLIQKLHPEVKTLVNQLKPDQPVPQATLDQLTQLFS